MQSEGPEPNTNTQPGAAHRVQLSDSSRSRSSEGDVARVSYSGPGPSPGPGPRNKSPSSSSSTTASIISSPNAGNSSHSSTPGPSVADLLSQLRASQSLERPASTTTTNTAFGGLGARGDRALERERERRSESLPAPDHTPNASPVPVPQIISTNAAHKPQQDIRTLSFHQALPHISQLMEDPHVVESLTKVINISLIHDFRFTSAFSF